MHVIKLLMLTTEYDGYVIGRRFKALARVHNIIVKHAKKLLLILKRDREYQIALNEYRVLLEKEKSLKEDETLPGADIRRKGGLEAFLDGCRKEIGLTESGLQAYAKKCGEQYSKLLSSQQIQKEASRVWKGVDAVLFKNGHDIHYKKEGDIHTIGGKSNTNGAKFNAADLTLDWMGLLIHCRPPKADGSGGCRDIGAWYTAKALEAKVSYCEIERQMFPDGYHYYVIVYLSGDAPSLPHDVNKGAVGGLDPGVSTAAAVADDGMLLEELAPKAKEYEKRIAELQRSMDRSLRAMNPENYNPDGTVRKNTRTFKKKWKHSRHYEHMKREVQSLYRQQAAYVKTEHGNLANRMLAMAGSWVTEDMAWQALAKKAKKTERQEKESAVTKKDGTVKQVHKYRRKKRFGHSIRSRSPGLLLSMLEKKCKKYGGCLAKVDMQTFMASQYSHDTDSCEKVPLSQREKEVAGRKVQRDLYSAFLAKNADAELKKPDREKCICEFEHFADAQDALIASMREQGISMKQCFGF